MNRTPLPPFLFLPIVFILFSLPSITATNSLVEVQQWIKEIQTAASLDATTKKQLVNTERFILSQQVDSVLYYLEASTGLLEKGISKKEFRRLNILKGKLYCNDLQQYDKAKSPLKAALVFVSRTEEPFVYLEVLDLLTKSYYWLFESEEAMNYAVEGLEYAKVIKDSDYELIFTQWVGRTLVIQGQKEEGLEYYERGLELAKLSDDPKMKYEANLNLACINYKIGNAKRGLDLLANCSDYLEEIEDKEERQADVWMWGGIMNGAIENYQEGTRLLRKAIPIFDRLDISHRRMHTRLELGSIHLKQGAYDKVTQVVESAFQLDPEKITPFEKKFGYTLLYQTKKSSNKHKEAVHYLEALNSINAQLDSTNNARYIQELEQKYQDKEQQQIIEQQQITISKRRWLGVALGLVSLLLLATFSALYFLNRSRKKLRHQKALIETQAQELRQLDQLKSNFFANVSHELRTPLTLMLGPVGSALKSGKLDERNFKLLTKAKESGRDLMQMIGSILDLSKVEANKMEVQQTPELLFPLARRIASAFESQAQINGIRYTFEYQAAHDLYLELDKNKLNIILNNLLSNALKFTKTGGEINFAVKDVGNAVQFRVKDTGRGIHPDDLPYIFDRFYQSKQVNAAIEGGTGIGLALCREFAQLMGGNVRVESELDKGSIFTALIGRKEILGTAPSFDASLETSLVIDAPTPIKAISKSPTTGATILVVEDNASLRAYLQTILSPIYKVVLAENGRKALDILEATAATNYPNLILSDIMMPEMDGYQLLENLKSKDAFRPIPVVMLTARADIQDRLKALRIGVDDYLLKPFEEEELLVRIENLLNNQQERNAIQITEEELPEPPSISKEDQDWLEQLETYLHKEISNNNYSITQLAYDLAISERQLRRRIKQLVGLSPSQYFKAIRLQHARQMLEQRKFNTIAQTAAAVGFLDASAFSRNFNRQFGKSPSEYLNF